MALGDKAYQAVVPKEAQQLSAERGLGEANWFIRGPDAPPHYTASVRSIIKKARALSPPAPEQPQERH